MSIQYLSVCLSIYVSIYRPIHPSFHPSVHPSFHPSSHSSIHPAVHLSIHPLIRLKAKRGPDSRSLMNRRMVSFSRWLIRRCFLFQCLLYYFEFQYVVNLVQTKKLSETYCQHCGSWVLHLVLEIDPWRASVDDRCVRRKAKKTASVLHMVRLELLQRLSHQEKQ